MRKPERLVKFEDTLSSEFFGDIEPIVGVVLRTHLALESLLVELIKTKQSGDSVWRWNFPRKTDFLRENGLISLNEKKAFDKYNDLRNDFAHVFGKRVGLTEMLTLARELENLGIEFSDSLGRYIEDQAIEFYDGIAGVTAEISGCILFHAAYVLFESGGRDIFSVFLEDE